MVLSQVIRLEYIPPAQCPAGAARKGHSGAHAWHRVCMAVRRVYNRHDLVLHCFGDVALINPSRQNAKGQSTFNKFFPTEARRQASADPPSRSTAAPATLCSHSGHNFGPFLPDHPEGTSLTMFRSPPLALNACCLRLNHFTNAFRVRDDPRNTLKV